MNRFASYVGIIGALFLGVFLATFFDNQVSLPTTANTQVASSTLVVTASNPILSPAPSDVSVATTTDVGKKKITTPVSVVAAPVAPKSIPLPSPTPVTAAELDASASMLRAALVNIMCYVSAGSGLHSISGSGIFIDPKGIILTNAHIAQYFLLTDQNVSCTIRSGSPARDSYTAALMYISPLWIKANAEAFTETLPSGTGEYDFALLAVTKSATNAALPTSFPFVPLATKPSSTGAPVVIASYGAQFLESNQIKFTLFPTIVFGSIKDVFTFAVNTVDVLALGGSVAAQEGSSGGGVVDASGALVGTITTSTVKGATDTRSLNAITASYIRAEYANETGEALDLLLNSPTTTSIADFAPQIPALEAILTAHLP